MSQKIVVRGVISIFAIVGVCTIAYEAVRTHEVKTTSLKFTLRWALPSHDAINGSSPTVATINSQPAVIVGDTGGYLNAFDISNGAAPTGWPVLTRASEYAHHPSSFYPTLGLGGPVSAVALSGGDSTIFDTVGGGNVIGGTANLEADYEAFSSSGVSLWSTNSQAESTYSLGETSKGSAPGLGGMTLGYSRNHWYSLNTSTSGHLIYSIDASNGNGIPGTQWPYQNTDSQLTTAGYARLPGMLGAEVFITADQTYNPTYGGSFSGGHLRMFMPNGQQLCNTNIYSPDPHNNYEAAGFDSSPAIGAFGGVPLAIIGEGTRWSDASYHTDSNQLLAIDSACETTWTTTLAGPTNFSPAIGDVLGTGTPAIIEETNNSFPKPTAINIYEVSGLNGAIINRMTLPTSCGTENVSTWDQSVTTADLTGKGYQDIVAYAGKCGWAIIDGRSMRIVTYLGTSSNCIVASNNSPLLTQDKGGEVGITVSSSTLNGSSSCVYHYETTGTDGRASLGSLSWPEYHHDPQLSGFEASSVPSSTPIEMLGPGDSLTSGQQIVSFNGNYKAVMQSTGNFAIYRLSGPSPKLVFQTSTYGHPGASIMMQTDGNLVVHSGSNDFWSSNTGNHNKWPTWLLMQIDGNLVVYQGPKTTSLTGPFDTPSAIWSSKDGTTGL